jgi:histidinol-phosphate aminotransferase
MNAIRRAVIDSPEYPFAPVDAPVKLDQNESPEDVPANLKAQALARLQATAWHRYPDLNAEALCDAIAVFEDWTPSGVVVTTGSNVLIALLTQIAGIGKRVITVKPSFALYALDATLLDAELTEVPVRPDLSVDIATIISEIQRTSEPESRGLVYLPQPQAPTGVMMPMTDIEALLQAANGWVVVLDEAYCHFSDADCKSIARTYPHVVLLRTFSKAWGLAGIRLGYALTSDAIARQIKKMAPPFAVSVLQAAAVQVALENPAYMLERVQTIIQERERVYHALLEHARWQAYRSAANFILIRTPDAARAYAQLLTRGVLVRRQDRLHGLAGCIRVTIGTSDENDAFLLAALAIK